MLRVSDVEISIHHPYLFPLGIPYHIHVTTGDVRNASTNARVYVILHGGEDGENNSGKLWLQNEKKDNFERGRTDIFTVETTDMLSPLHHLTIGHDNSGLGAGWYCEKVMSSHHLCFLLLTSDALELRSEVTIYLAFAPTRPPLWFLSSTLLVHYNTEICFRFTFCDSGSQTRRADQTRNRNDLNAKL